MLNNKKYRFEAIKKLITQQEINNQDELLKKLTELNISVTQATLSRDLRELKVSKVPNSTGQYIYQITDNSTSTILNKDNITLAFSKNIAVLKTMPSFASRIAFEIDHSQSNNILGTIAGDDTIFILMKENCNQNDVVSEIKEIIPNIKHKNSK